MSKQINIQDSIVLSPTGYTGLSNLTTTTSYPVDNGYDNSNSTTYARFTLSSGATGYLYYTFDAPEIPTGATIDSVTCSVRARVSSTTRVTNTVCQLYTNTTAKGGNSTFASTSSTNTFNLTTGTWTISELQNIRLRVGGTGSSSSGSGSSSRYIYFYGATFTINYSISGTAYTITASSTVSGATASPATQDIIAGNNATVTIEANDISEITVTDNNTDVTESLVRHTTEAGSYSPTFIPSSFDSINSSYDSIYNNNNPENGCTAHGSSTRLCAYSNKGDSAVSVAFYNFDCSSIPQNATITSVSCIVSASCYSSGSYFATKDLQLYVGTTTPKGTAVTVTGNGSTSADHTVNGGTTWTRAELDNLKIRFYVVRNTSNSSDDASFSFFGATLTVNYTITPENPYYWTYDLTNLSADHVVLIEEAGVYIPPEEDPQYDYQSLTISSINAVTTPGSGTTRVIEGSNQTITIVPSDPQLTLALDNGVDITSQLVGGVPSNTYTVTGTVSGASYGFTLNNSTGYYTSTNAGQASSAAVCRVNFTCESACLVTIQYINYAEGTYDYGIFGLVDTALGTTYTADSNTYLSCSTSAQNTSTPQTLTYNLTAGSHFIDIKYRKDSYTDSNNDNLQWKILSIEATEGGDYTYTLNNITTSHSLVFVFGAVNYYFITSSGSNCRLFPDGQQVKLEGDSYRLVIVPDNVTDNVSITDNNTNVTSLLEREDGYDKNNNPAVSYTYRLTNIQTAHNLVISSVATSSAILYLKQSNSWVQVEKIFLKSNGAWVEQSLDYLSVNDIDNLIQG